MSLRITNKVDYTLQAGVETTVTPDTIFSPSRESSTQVLLNYAVFLSAVGASAIANGSLCQPSAATPMIHERLKVKVTPDVSSLKGLILKAIYYLLITLPSMESSDVWHLESLWGFNLET